MKHLLSQTIFLLALTSTINAQTLAPMTVTGFNRDVIAETASTSAVTSGGMDIGGNIWYSQSFVNAVQASYGGGLPDARTITSANNSLISYKMMSYNGNNALYMVGDNNSGTNTGTLTLAVGNSYSKISFLVAGTEGSPSMKIKLKFSDNSTTTVGSSLTVADWFSGASPAAQNLGRVSGTPGSYTFSGRDGSNNPRLYEITFTLSATDKHKTISSISFTKNDDDNSTRALVFAVSGALSASSLPVIFSGVEGKRDNNNNALVSWQTQQESNTAYFDIERSTGNDVYTTVGRVAAAGNSSLVKNYRYADNNTATAYYRICEVDADGTKTYSEVVLVKSGNTAATTFQQSGSNLVVSGINAPAGSNVDYMVYNSGGAVLAHGKAVAGATLIVNMAGLPKGVYILNLVSGAGQTAHRFMN